MYKELDNKGYICPQCNKAYAPLEVDKLMDFSRLIFVCEDCHAEVVENENAENVKGSQDRMQRFNHQMRFVVEGLRKTESMVLPVCVYGFISDIFVLIEYVAGSTFPPG
jgi:transcription initiation factor TFIIE subunit alpha